MASLVRVDFAPDAPDALQCVMSLTRVIIGGEIDDELADDAGNVVRCVAKVVSDATDHFLANRGGETVMHMLDPLTYDAWTNLAFVLDEDVTMPLRRRDNSQSLSSGNIPWDLIIRLALAALQRYIARKSQ